MAADKFIIITRRGFSLLEIMVVIAILGIITTVGITSYRSVQRRSRDSQRKANLERISFVLESYYNDKGQYPNDNGVGGQIMGCGAGDAQLCDWGAALVDSQGTIYMTQLPDDPTGNLTYFYDVGAGNNSYQLYARIEDLADKDILNSSGNPIIFQGVSCGATTCNFGVSSPNTTPETGRTVVEE